MMVSQLLLLVLTLPLVAPFSTIYPTRALLPPKTRTTLCDVRNDNAGKFGLAQSTYDGEVSPWIYSYADLTPETDQTIVGALFLATNVPFLIVGSFFSAKAVLESGLSGLEGELATFSGLTDLAGIVSIWYHWSQLHFGPNRKEVRTSLIIDYCTALSIIIYSISLISANHINLTSDISLLGQVSGVGAAACLGVGWLREEGPWYLFWHSGWHVLSALAGFELAKVLF